jgi:hypothetical protein
MATKRQTTMAKLAREQSVREKRVRKQKRKDERRAAAALGLTVDGEPLDGVVLEASDEDGFEAGVEAEPEVAVTAPAE